MKANFRSTPEAEDLPVVICGSSTFGIKNKISSALTYNMFISENWLMNFPGFKKVLALGVGENVTFRGFFNSIRGGFILAVAGQNVYRIDSSRNLTTLSGTLATTSGEVSIDENLNGQICIVDGLHAYIYNYQTNSAVTVQTDAPFGTDLIPNYVSFHNTFFLIGNASPTSTGARWYVYKYDAGQPNPATTIYLQTDLSISTKPDSALAVKRLPGQSNNVIVFGRSVCEIWTAVGGLQNYRRNSSINIDYGCASVHTIAGSDQFICWLAINETNKPVIMVFAEEGFQRISTDGIDNLLSSVKRPDLSTAFFFRQYGHLFYQLTFFSQEDNFTIAYDFNTEKFFNLSDYDNSCHPARDIVYFNDSMYFGSLKNNCIYETGSEFLSYNENISDNHREWDKALNHAIPRVRISDSIRKPSSARFIANSFVFTMEQGNDINFTGLTTGYQPRVDLRISKDAGITWSNAVSRKLNPIGHRQNIITFGNMGRANDLTIRIEFWGLGSFIATDGLLEAY